MTRESTPLLPARCVEGIRGEMARSTRADDVEALWERAEAALASGETRNRQEARSLLDRLERAASPQSEAGLWAARQLGELLVEESPWRAALLLRRVIARRTDDDAAYALAGLAHALLGNIAMAVSSYRRAIALVPRSPWYHHNVGHLLDVGLGRPQAALFHLRLANKERPDEDEIAASLAHCLARLGQLEEAERLARFAVSANRAHAGHRQLLEWIEQSGRERASERSGSSPREATRRRAPRAKPRRRRGLE